MTSIAWKKGGCLETLLRSIFLLIFCALVSCFKVLETNSVSDLSFMLFMYLLSVCFTIVNLMSLLCGSHHTFCFVFAGCVHILSELVSHQLDILVTIIPWRDSFYWLNALPNSVVRWVISTGIVTQCGRMSHQHRDCHSIYYLMLCSGGSLIHTEINRSGTSTGTWELQILLVPFMKTCNNNNHREFIERFWNLKALYNLKKNIQCTNTHNYTNHSIHAYKTYEN